MRWGWTILAVVFSITSTLANCDQDLKALYLESELFRLHQDNAPGMAVVVIVTRDQKVLMNQRSSGYWGFAGGKYEASDASIAECAKREALEEAGIKIRNLQLKQLQRIFIEEQGKVFVSAIVTAEIESGEPKLLEPEKSLDWKWFRWNELPNPLFPPNQTLIAKGFSPFQ